MAYMERRTRPSANHLVTDRVEQQRFARHLAKIGAARSTLDNRPPREPKVNAKRAYFLEERYTVIERDNLHLLSKMHRIMREPDAIGRPLGGQTSMNIRIRRNDLVRITRENHVRVCAATCGPALCAIRELVRPSCRPSLSASRLPSRTSLQRSSTKTGACRRNACVASRSSHRGGAGPRATRSSPSAAARCWTTPTMPSTTLHSRPPAGGAGDRPCLAAAARAFAAAP